MHKQWRDEITLPTSVSIHVNCRNPWALKEESQVAGMYPGPRGTLWDSCAHFCLTWPLSWPPLASCTEQQLVLVHSCPGDGAPLKWVTGTTWCKCLFLSFHCREPWVTLSVVPGEALWDTSLLLLQVKGLEFGVAQKRARESKGKVPGGSTLQCLLDGALPGSGLQSSTGEHCKASCAVCGELRDSWDAFYRHQSLESHPTSSKAWAAAQRWVCLPGKRCWRIRFKTLMWRAGSWWRDCQQGMLVLGKRGREVRSQILPLLCCILAINVVVKSGTGKERLRFTFWHTWEGSGRHLSFMAVLAPGLHAGLSRAAVQQKPWETIPLSSLVSPGASLGWLKPSVEHQRAFEPPGKQGR